VVQVLLFLEFLSYNPERSSKRRPGWRPNLTDEEAQWNRQDVELGMDGNGV
jgi:hypothetical protein